ncbi:CipC protein [Mycena maculata]|uniref:CipC protein n=1 Tax=Mycena maculata TaxID=230809 RepID=A0AAD7HB55_9AGAR|nr:CipC protein [Mycena maculata]
MGWFESDESSQKQAYEQYQNLAPEEHKAKLSHELISGAAAFEAAKAYEQHCATEGQPTNHAVAKELIAGFVGAFIDREVETKGLDLITAERAKKAATKQAQQPVIQQDFQAFYVEDEYTDAHLNGDYEY